MTFLNTQSLYPAPHCSAPQSAFPLAPTAGFSALANAGASPNLGALVMGMLSAFTQLGGAWNGLGGAFGASGGFGASALGGGYGATGAFAGGGYANPGPIRPGPVLGGGNAGIAGSNAAFSAGPQSGTRIGAGNNVLVIGDSHTSGAFGEELDRNLRSTGAQVETFSSSGSEPDWWLTGQPTTSGAISIGPDGRESRTPSGVAQSTPRIQDLINRYHPDTIVINMGQNLRGKSPGEVARQVQQLEQVAKSGGARIIWVGSPPTANDAQDGGQQYRNFTQFLGGLASQGGASFIDSGRLVPGYQGNDGIHYAPGAAAAWADALFRSLQS